MFGFTETETEHSSIVCYLSEIFYSSRVPSANWVHKMTDFLHVHNECFAFACLSHSSNHSILVGKLVRPAYDHWAIGKMVLTADCVLGIG